MSTEKDMSNEALLAREQERAKKKKAKLDEHALERRVLVDKFEDALGPEGEQFEVLDVKHHGWIVVKHGDSVVHKRFSSSEKEEADFEAYVIPNLAHPTADEFRVIIEHLPGILSRCAVAIHSLYGEKLKTDEGKF